MKLTVTLTLLAAAIPALPAIAQQGPASYYEDQEPAGEWATVRQVVPMVERSAPRRVCQDSSVAVMQPQGSTGGGVVGTVVGAALGNQAGHGRGRVAATIVGAVVGGNVGYATGPQDGVVSQVPTTQCQVVSGGGQRAAGYRVTYTYGGRTYESVMATPPGSRIRVRVSVLPVESGYDSRPDPRGYAPALAPVPSDAPRPVYYPPMSQAQPMPQGYMAPQGYAMQSGYQAVAYQQQSAAGQASAQAAMLAMAVAMSGAGRRDSGSYRAGYDQGFQTGAVMVASAGHHGGHRH